MFNRQIGKAHNLIWKLDFWAYEQIWLISTKCWCIWCCCKVLLTALKENSFLHFKNSVAFSYLYGSVPYSIYHVCFRRTMSSWTRRLRVQTTHGQLLLWRWWMIRIRRYEMHTYRFCLDEHFYVFPYGKIYCITIIIHIIGYVERKTS